MEPTTRKRVALASAVAVGVVLAIAWIATFGEREHAPAVVPQAAASVPATAEPMSATTDFASPDAAAPITEAHREQVAEPTANARATAEVRVVHADGTPAVDVEVRAWRDGDLGSPVWTDGRGVAHVDVAESAIELFARSPFGPPARASLAAGATSVELRFTHSALVAGRVTVDGATPVRPVEVLLLAHRPPELSRDLPGPVRAWCMQGDLAGGARTDTNGAFRFHVVPEFRGEVTFQSGRWGIQGDRSVDVPRTDILLHLTSRTVVRGILVGELPSDGELMVMLVLPGAEPWQTEVTYPRRGERTFEVPFTVTEPTRADLVVLGARDEQLAERAIELVPGEDLDVGGLVLRVVGHRVEAAPTTRLELRLAASDAGPIHLPHSGLFLRLSFDAGALGGTDPRRAIRFDHAATQAESFGTPGDLSPRIAGRVELRVFLGDAYTQRVEALPADVPFDVFVETQAEEVLWSAEALVLETNEQRVLEVELPPLRILTVDVLDALGEPVNDALVLFTRAGSVGEMRRDNREALLPLEVFGDRVSLFVLADGYPPASFHDLIVPLDGLHKTVRLERSERTAEVEVVDARRAPALNAADHASPVAVRERPRIRRT